MRHTRLLGSTTIVVLGSLALAAGGTGAAGATAAGGVGTASATTTVVEVQLGDGGSLLDLALLADRSGSTIDPRVSSRAVADTKISPFTVGSKVLPALNVAAPSAEARSTGTAQSVAVPAVSIPAAVPSSVLSGSVSPATLSAVVDSAGARSGLTSGFAAINVAGGAVLSLPSGSSDLTTSAASSESNGFRGVKVGTVSALKLGALLKGLGIDPTSLPLSTVNGLVTQLGTTVAGVSDPASLVKQLSSLNDAVNNLTAAINSAAGSSVVPEGPATSATNTALGTVAGIAGTAASAAAPITGNLTPVSQATQELTALTSQLQSLLGKTLAALDGTPLVTVDSVQVGLTAKAGDSAAHSVANVTASIGAVHIGSLTVPGVDLAASSAPVQALADSVNAKLSSVLSTVSPDLSKLVSVKPLAKSASVSSAGSYTRADAGIAALRVTVTPPSDLAALVASFQSAASGTGTVGSLLGSAVPALPQASAVNQLASGLSLPTGALAALAKGMAVTVGQVQAESDFAPAAVAGVHTTGPTGPVAQLPMTGGRSSMALLGGLLMAMGAAMVAVLRRTARGPVARASKASAS